MTPLSDAFRWLFPPARRAPLPGDPGHGPPPEYTIVYPPTMLWSNHQRPQHMLTQLARRHDVRCLFNDWTVRERRLEGGKLVVTKRAFSAHYYTRPLVYYFSIPDKLDYLAQHSLRPDVLVFELMDLPEQEFAGWKETLPRALARSDLIRTTHPSITDYLREHYAAEIGDKEISTSRNGVDLELFDPHRANERPAALRGVEKPILGFYGNLDAWIDWDVMRRLAGLSEYQVVVIGGTEGMAPKVPSELYRDAPIIWVEKQPVTEIPRWLAHFDVALFPFVVNDMTNAVDPLKVWEYLAFGKPVLATPTAFARAHADVLEVVESGEDLREVVERAMTRRDDPERVAVRRQAAAAGRDWSVIADEMHAEVVASVRPADP